MILEMLTMGTPMGIKFDDADFGKWCPRAIMGPIQKIRSLESTIKDIICIIILPPGGGEKKKKNVNTTRMEGIIDKQVI